MIIEIVICLSLKNMNRNSRKVLLIVKSMTLMGIIRISTKRRIKIRQISMVRMENK